MTWRSGLQRSEQRASIRCNAIDPWSVNAEVGDTCSGDELLFFVNSSPLDLTAPPISTSQSLASQLFAVSLFPYLAFLFFLNKAKVKSTLPFGW